MKYRLTNSKQVSEIQDSNPVAALSKMQAQLAAMGEGTTVEELPDDPVTELDPAAKLANDKRFGKEIVDSFLSASKAANLGLYETEIIDTMLDKVERYLLRGSISVAKEALELVEPNQLFPAQAKAYYLQLITAHLNEQV